MLVGDEFDFVRAINWLCKNFDIFLFLYHLYTDDIYLKLRLVIYYQKENPYQ